MALRPRSTVLIICTSLMTSLRHKSRCLCVCPTAFCLLSAPSLLPCSLQQTTTPSSTFLLPIDKCILLIQAPTDGWSSRVHLALHACPTQSPSLAYPPPASSPNGQPPRTLSCLCNNTTHEPHTMHLAHGSSASAPFLFKVSSGIGILATAETPTL